VLFALLRSLGHSVKFVGGWDTIISNCKGGKGSGGCCWFREFETSDIDLTADGAFMFGFFISSASPLQQAFYEKAWAYLTEGGRHA